MKNIHTRLLTSRIKKYYSPFHQYSKEILEYNLHTYRVLSSTSILVFSILSIISWESFFREIYLFTAISLLTLLLSSYRNTPFKCVRGYIYGAFTITFLVAIYLSVVASPTHRASAILGLFCLFPLTFIERGELILIYEFGMYFLHTALSIYFKGLDLGIDDALTTGAFVIFGVVVGFKNTEARIENIASKAEVIQQRDKDFLTGLFTRRKLFDYVNEKEIAPKPNTLSVIMLDVDYFKTVNDNLGHSYGDHCLMQIGKTLQEISEPLNGEFFRYGGEEFVGVFANYSIEEIAGIAQKLQKAINNLQLNSPKSQWGVVTLSVGIAYSEEIVSEKCFEDLVNKADQAMYCSKKSGKNRYTIYEPCIPSLCGV